MHPGSGHGTLICIRNLTYDTYSIQSRFLGQVGISSMQQVKGRAGMCIDVPKLHSNPRAPLANANSSLGC